MGNITSSTKPEIGYKTHCTAVRKKPNHGQRLQVLKMWWHLAMWFFRYATGQTDKQTCRNADGDTSLTYVSRQFYTDFE